jgi:threonine dehydrogenase-like Zn-dependent dehydrogenase
MSAMGRAVWIDRPGELRVRPAEPARPGPREALVRVAYAGICGSDREVLAGTRPAEYVRYPVLPGHEWSGTVADVGPDADPGLVGRKVVGEGFRGCGACSACRRGEDNLCQSGYAETGFTEPGAWSDFVTLPAALLHTLPEDADLRSAAGLEPAACVAAACLRVGLRPGERAAVVGAGMLGLLGVQLLAAAGAGEIVAVDPNPGRAEPAERCGAAALVTPEVAAGYAGGFDVVLEAAGASGTAALAVELARRGGRVALTGIPARDARPPDPATMVLSALTVHTVFGALPMAWAHAVRAFAAGLLDPGVLVGSEVGLEDAETAFRLLDDERAGTVKVLLVP